MITVYRILTGKDKVDANQCFQQMVGAASIRQNRGFLGPEKPPASKLDMRRNHFSQRVLEDWNNLPDWVKMSKDVNSFKNKLDRQRN